MLIKPKSWERHGLKPWIEAAMRVLSHFGAGLRHYVVGGPGTISPASSIPQPLTGEGLRSVSNQRSTVIVASCLALQWPLANDFTLMP